MYLVFIGCSTTRNSQDAAYDYFKKNYRKLIEIFGDASEGVFLHCFEASSAMQSTEDFAQELETFFNGAFDCEQKAALGSTFKQSQEAVRLNANLFKTHHASISEFLLQ